MKDNFLDLAMNSQALPNPTIRDKSKINSKKRNQATPNLSKK